MITDISISPVGFCEMSETDVIRKAALQLEEYFAGERHEFDLPLAPKGSDFSRKVWDALLDVPYGETWNYKDIAEMISSPMACRAVGNANGKNPIMIVIPCHRIVSSDGSIGGYSSGIDIKKKLLKLEKKYKNRRV